MANSFFRKAYRYNERIEIHAPWYRRLTPLARIGVSVLLVALVVGLVALVLPNILGWLRVAPTQQAQSTQAPSIADTAQTELQRPIIVRAAANAHSTNGVTAAAGPADKSVAVVPRTPISVVVQPVDSLSAVRAMSEEDRKTVIARGGSGGNIIARQLKQYFDSIKKMPMQVYLAEREVLLKTYFAGAGLTAMAEGEGKRETYDYFKEGDVDVRVVSVSGRNAVVQVKPLGLVRDVYDLKTRKVAKPDVVVEPQNIRLRVVYDASAERWKFAEAVDLTRADEAADAESTAAGATPAAPQSKTTTKP
jgi:hypothetical protein